MRKNYRRATEIITSLPGTIGREFESVREPRAQDSLPRQAECPVTLQNLKSMPIFCAISLVARRNWPGSLMKLDCPPVLDDSACPGGDGLINLAVQFEQASLNPASQQVVRIERHPGASPPRRPAILRESDRGWPTAPESRRSWAPAASVFSSPIALTYSPWLAWHSALPSPRRPGRGRQAARPFLRRRLHRRVGFVRLGITTVLQQSPGFFDLHSRGACRSGFSLGLGAGHLPGQQAPPQPP